MAHFLLRNKLHIKDKLIPIFDQYPLLTSKEYSYTLFKKALEIWDNNDLSQEGKIKEMNRIKSFKIREDYISTA